MPMGNSAKSARDGGQEFHVADCYVWAEIHYLDSPTDYREYLPANVPLPQRRPHDEPMVLLDDSTRSFWRSFSKTLLILSMIAFAVLLVNAILQEL